MRGGRGGKGVTCGRGRIARRVGHVDIGKKQKATKLSLALSPSILRGRGGLQALYDSRGDEAWLL